MSEVIEHKLHQLNGQPVVVVRPGFGTQSDSWSGTLNTIEANEYPYRFQFRSIGSATIFTADDVVSIEQKTIRLKGPSDYVTQYEPHHS